MLILFPSKLKFVQDLMVNMGQNRPSRVAPSDSFCQQPCLLVTMAVAPYGVVHPLGGVILVLHPCCRRSLDENLYDSRQGATVAKLCAFYSNYFDFTLPTFRRTGAVSTGVVSEILCNVAI